MSRKNKKNETIENKSHKSQSSEILFFLFTTNPATATGSIRLSPARTSIQWHPKLTKKEKTEVEESHNCLLIIPFSNMLIIPY